MQLHAIGHGVRNVLSIFLAEYCLNCDKFTQRSPLALSPRQGPSPGTESKVQPDLTRYCTGR
jgi:hypothetical protein